MSLLTRETAGPLPAAPSGPIARVPAATFRAVSLLVGGIRADGGISVENFREALSGRLYLQAILNSLILGLWTALFSVLIGLPLAWTVSRSNVPFKALIQITATLSGTLLAFVNPIALFGSHAIIGLRARKTPRG